MYEYRPPQTKPNTNYIFYRAYCLTVVVLWNIVGFTVFMKTAETREPAPIAFLLLIPFAIVAIFMIFSLGAFRLPYSIFGHLLRTQAPTDKIILSVNNTWGKIAWFNATMPLFSYNLHSSGLELVIKFIGKAFLPLRFVDRLESGFFKGYKVYHNSPEIRSPITLPNKKLFEEFNNQFKRYRTGTAA